MKQEAIGVPATFTEIVLRAFLENNFKIIVSTKYGDKMLTNTLVSMFKKEKEFYVIDEVKQTRMFFLFGFIPIPISSTRYFKRAHLIVNETERIAQLDIYDIKFGGELHRKNVQAELPGSMLNLNLKKVDSAIEYTPAPFYYDEDSVVIHNPLI